MNNIDLGIGYGIAGYNMILGLKNMGIHVPFEDPTAPVEYGFVMPCYVEWSNPDAYHILCFPWETTVIPDDWHRGLESADELWVTSPFTKQVVESYGYTVTKIYEHGIGKEWVPKLRQNPVGPIKYLMIGGEAPRKNSAMAWQAFYNVFGTSPDVHLTVKSNTYTGDRVYDGEDIIGVPYEMYPNMTNITNELEPDEMVKLVEDHDIMLYPSFGEGFGLIPLQGLASGMPTICTRAWAPYTQFMEPELLVDSTLGESFIQNLHPGNWFIPNMDSLEDAVRSPRTSIIYPHARMRGQTQSRNTMTGTALPKRHLGL
jgi:hypothetical protein